MARRNNWWPTAEVHFEPVRDSEYSEILAELGTLIYDELCSRQLRSKFNPSIATERIPAVSEHERKVANE